MTKFCWSRQNADTVSVIFENIILVELPFIRCIRNGKVGMLFLWAVTIHLLL